MLAHEFQHLINASRRLYVTQGVEEFEVTWLNEGLSHIAEELLFYRESSLTPRQNIDSIRIRSTNTIRNAFNNDMSSNTSRYRSFLVAPSENSPFRDDDSLETRGATWNLLRYLADRKAGVDAATWQALVNTTRVGLPNLSAVFGSDIASKVRDWNVSHYTDDAIVRTSGGAPAAELGLAQRLQGAGRLGKGVSARREDADRRCGIGDAHRRGGRVLPVLHPGQHDGDAHAHGARTDRRASRAPPLTERSPTQRGRPTGTPSLRLVRAPHQPR